MQKIARTGKMLIMLIAFLEKVAKTWEMLIMLIMLIVFDTFGEGMERGVGGGQGPREINMINISPVLSTFWGKSG